MIRRLSLYSLFSLLVVATLLLLVSTLRGYRIADAYQWPGADHRWPGPDGLHLGTRYSLSSWRGRFYFVAEYEFPPGCKARWLSQSASAFNPFGYAYSLRTLSGRPITSNNYLLFQSHTVIGQPSISSLPGPNMLLERHVIAPAWVPLALGTALILWLVFPMRRRWQKASRRRQGLCLKCGYDLRAHHPGEKCPECGTPAAGPILSKAPYPP